MIVVNPTTRQFNIPGADLVFGVTADANSAIKHFQCPRIVGNNVDISSSFVRINYRNANGEIDFYLVKDMTVEGDNITFSWELHPNVTMYKGNISFVMCVTGPDTKVKWHTTLGRGQVLEGLEPDNALVETETSDGIAALIAMVEAQTEAVADKGAEWVRNVQLEGTDQIIAVQTAGAESKAAAVAEIEAKGKNVRESIPDDYTSLGNAVDSLVRGRAGAIVCEVEGSAIAVKDASDNYLQGLRIFGKSTQNGVPTPDAPVEIENVENPVVTVAGKNLVPPETSSYNAQGISSAPGDGCTVVLDGTATQEMSRIVSKGIVLTKGKYTLSAHGLNVIDSNKDRVYLSSVAGGILVNYVKTNTPVSFDVEEDVVATASIVFAPGSTYTNKQIYLQLEAGDTATAYEPYKPVQTIETTHPLRGIPVTSGGNYTDSNGQQWVCDEVDLDRGVYVQRTKKVTLTGAMNIGKSLPNDEASWMYYYVTPNKEMNDTVPVLCDSLQYKTSLSPYNSIGFRNSNDGNSVIYFNMSTYMTENKIDALGAVLNEYPITFVYSLMKPIETTLSETEIAAYRALHTYKPNTTIVNDSGAHMKVEYAADTKLYIDNKLAALVGNT